MHDDAEAEPSPHGSAPRRWLRRFLIVGLALFLLGVLAWQVVERALDVDQYRPQLQAELQRITGLPVTIARLDLVLAPVPVLSVVEVSIGVDEFLARADRVDLHPELAPLWHRRVELSSIEVEALAVVLPEALEAADERWQAVREHVQAAFHAPPSTSSANPGVFVSGFSIHRVDARDAVISWGAGTTHPVRVDATATGVDGESMRLELSADVSTLGTLLTGAMHVPFSGFAGASWSGDFTLTARPPDSLAELPDSLRSAIEARIEVRGDPAADLELTWNGDVAALAPSAFAGVVSGHAQWHSGRLLDSVFSATGRGLALVGGIELASEARPILRVDALDLTGEALEGVLGLQEESLRFAAAPDARLSARDVRISIEAADSAPLLSGSITASGLQALWGGALLARPITLAATATDGIVAIDQLGGGPVALAGELAIDPAWSRFALALRGEIVLTDALLALSGDSGFEDAAGTFQLHDLRAVFTRGDLPGEPLALSGDFVNGSLRYVSGGFRDELSQMAIRVAGSPGEWDARGHARSRVLGDLAAHANVLPEEHSLRGELHMDVGAVAGYLASGPARDQVAPLLEAYGPSDFELTASWPPGADGSIELNQGRGDVPGLAVQVALPARGSTGRTPGSPVGLMEDLGVRAALPAGALRGVLPKTVETEGVTRWQLTRRGPRFTLEGDLSELAMRAGRLLRKQAGEPLQLTLQGRVGAGDWTPESLLVKVPSESLALELTEGAISADDLDVDLAAWSLLLAEGVKMSGRLGGSFHSGQERFHAALDDVAFELAPGLGLDRADGEITRDGDRWSLRGLRLRGARSDATLDASVEDGRITGRLSGKALDADLVRTLVSDIRALLPDAPAEEPARELTGDVEVALESVGMGRAELRGFLADVSFDANDIQVPALAFETYEGRVAGSVALRGWHEASPRLEVELQVHDVTGRFLDDLVFAEPRGIRGSFRASLSLSGPATGGLRHTLADANGRLSWTARDGSFGKLGIATRLTTVLRSTEALRLRMPPLKDQGLVFDHVEADFPIQAGRLEVARFELDSTAYAISAHGFVDFERDETQVPIEVNAIKGLTSVLDRVPVAGDMLKIANVRLTATGSPFDVRVRVASVQDHLVAATLTGPKAMIKGVRDAMGLVRHANGARDPVAPAGSPALEPETGPEPETSGTTTPDDPAEAAATE